MINVTSIAAEKISELLTDEGKPSAGLRVFVQGGGCSGFQYGLMIEESEPTADVDRIVESNGVRLFVVAGFGAPWASQKRARCRSMIRSYSPLSRSFSSELFM